MHTRNRDYALIDDIVGYLEMLADDADAFAARGMDKRANTIRAKAYRSVADDIRSIEIIGIPPREAQP